MSTTNVNKSWKHPNEFMKLQRRKQLVARLSKNSTSNAKIAQITESDKTSLLEAKIAQKRKNPFAKNAQEPKKIKPDDTDCDSLLSIIEAVPSRDAITAVSAKEKSAEAPAFKLKLQPFDAQKFSKLLLQQQQADKQTMEDEAARQRQKFSKHLPMDWTLKTRLRFFCSSELPSTALKSSQLASGLTSFVRCIDPQQSSNSSLDISPATRLSQATYYWQHPHLPWLTLFPRNSKNNIGITLGDRERKALAEDWEYSFQGLFQLLRARQCPYFYLCANSFTVLFRAAGTGGLVETHALMTPSTRGVRAALRQEGIEYTLPLKRDGVLNRSADSAFSEESNSLSLGGDHVLRECSDSNLPAADENDDSEEEEDWLESLGVDEREIRKIKNTHTRQVKAQEMADDYSDNSLLLFEGVECQGFFSYLLNAKSTITSVGRLAGVPPTLLAPVAFPRATVQHLSMRSSKVRMDGVVYSCIDMKGIVLPTVLPYASQLLGETKDVFSAALASNVGTLAFSKATQKLLEESKKAAQKDSEIEPLANCSDDATGQVFGQENLSDCGLLPSVIECICRRGQDAVGLLEHVCYDREHGYAWS